MRGQRYLIEFAFFGDRDRLKQQRAAMLAADYNKDTSQSDQMLIFVRPLPFDREHSRSANQRCRALTSMYGVTFDGWSINAYQS